MKCSAGVYALFFFFFFVRCRLSVETLLRVCIYIQYESNVTYSLIHFIIDANDVLKYKWHQRNHSLNIWCDRYVMKSIIKSFWLYWIWSRPDRNDCLIIFKERFLIPEINDKSNWFYLNRLGLYVCPFHWIWIDTRTYSKLQFINGGKKIHVYTCKVWVLIWNLINLPSFRWIRGFIVKQINWYSMND